MGTNFYFDKEVTDAASDETLNLSVATSGFAGNGPQLLLKLGGASIILSHDDAKAFCEAVSNIEGYFGYQK